MSTYLEELEVVADAFTYELCGDCGRDLEDHTITPDMFGHPHAWCNEEELVS